MEPHSASDGITVPNSPNKVAFERVRSASKLEAVSVYESTSILKNCVALAKRKEKESPEADDGLLPSH